MSFLVALVGILLLTSELDLQEQENRDLLERFRTAHSEMKAREQKLQQAEGLNTSIRLELLSSDTERRQLRDTVGQQDREIQQVRRSSEVKGDHAVACVSVTYEVDDHLNPFSFKDLYTHSPSDGTH